MSKEKRKKILICGAGSIGVYIGVMLHLKNHDVKLLGRRKLQGVKETVLINGKEYDVPEKLFRFPKDYSPDFIFITTKLYDFEKMVRLIKNSKVRYNIIAAAQNGLVDTSKHSQILGKKIKPITIFSGFSLDKGKIVVHPTKVGWITEQSREGKEISKLLADAGIPCKSAKNFDSLRAEKTIVNSCLNAMSAIENKPFNKLFENAKTRDRVERLFYECYYILSHDYKLKNSGEMKAEMFKNWSKLKHYSSTHQDINSGRKNEVEFFNGYMVELGRKYGLPIAQNLKILEDVEKISKR